METDVRAMNLDAPPCYELGSSTYRGGRLRCSDVHDYVAEAEERLGVERLREEVGDVVRGADEGHLELEGLDHVAHEEVAARDVLGLVVVLRVVREVARCLVVAAKE